MKIIDFIKSLFFPREMKRHRYMSLLFAICLFVLEFYLIIAPASSYYTRNTHKLVEENNLYYLQSISQITETEELDNFVKELQDKGIRSGSEDITDSDLAFDSLAADESVLGIIKKDTESDYWIFNDKKTDVRYDTSSDEKPIITATDGAIIINNVSKKEISLENVSKDDNIELVTITSSDDGRLKVNNETTKLLITSSNPIISLDGTDIMLDNTFTGKKVSENVKVIFYFVPNYDVYFYENEYTYTSNSGEKNHITFTINTKATTLDECVHEYSEELYPNIEDENYFFVTVAQTFVSYQANPKGIDELNIEKDGTKLQCATIMVPYSNTGEFTFDGLQTKDFASYLLSKLEIGYTLFAVQSLDLQIGIYCLVFTLIVTCLFFLLFKKNGRLKTFREYYNIASLANIVPAIISFILMWINPLYVGSSYLFIFSIYYLFVLFRINNSPEKM